MDHIGKVTVVEAGGKEYKLSRFTRKLLARFLDWADKVLPDPLASLKGKLDGFPANVQEKLVEDAIQRGRLRKSINSPDVQALMSSPEGMLKIIALLFQEYQPGMTDAEVELVFDQCLAEQGPDYLAEKIAEATGRYEAKESDQGGDFRKP